MDNLIKLLHALQEIDFFQALLSFVLVIAFIVMMLAPSPNPNVDGYTNIMTLVLGFWFGSKNMALKISSQKADRVRAEQSPLSST